MARIKKTQPELEIENQLNFDSQKDLTVIESMDAQRVDWNVGFLVEMMDTGIVNFDAPVQRGYVWNNKKDSLAIRSILRHIPISNFYFNKVGGVYEGLEGKQRSNAIYRFVKGDYKLHSKTPPIKVNNEVYQIARKTFRELPKPLQNRILRYGIDGHWFDDMSIDEKVDFFILTNSGKPVTAAEISRIRIKSRDIFLSLVEHHAIKVAVSEKNQRKCMDEDIVSQLWCMCYNESPSLLQKDIGPVLATIEVTEEQKQEMIHALDYLSALYKNVGDDKKLFSKMKGKTHIISLAYMAYLAIRSGIMEDEYIKKAKSFFGAEGRTATVSDEYNKAVGSGSSKPEQVKIRMNEIKRALK